MQQYTDVVKSVLKQGKRKPSRTGVDTMSVFNVNYSVDLMYGFPLLTTKEISWKNILIENLWFLSGSTNIDFLHHYGVHFWDAWADERGEVPSAYGHFWRNFPSLGLGVDIPSGMTTHLAGQNDQIAWALNELSRDRYSRRAVVSAWSPTNAQNSSLPPCHTMFVLNVQAEAAGFDTLNLHLTQRSADVGIGVPYNLAGYSFLLSLFSRFLKWLVPGKFAHSIVDAHIYTSDDAEDDHVPGLSAQVQRTPRKLQSLRIDNSIQSLYDVDCIIRARPPIEELMRLFHLVDYNPHPPIKLKVAA
jgi:thymidylate synthase